MANYEYDGHGRRTTQWRSDGTVRVSLYTLDGRLQGEADNRAVGSTDYLYLGSTLVARRFQHWSGSPPVVTYHHSDALGSPVAVSNAGGQLQSREWYTSYGAPTDGATEDQIGYTGHQSDPVTGLVYAQQRYYDPLVGRFLSVDPVTTNPNTGASFNRYNYANNNPYRFIDPDGREAGAAYSVIYRADSGQAMAAPEAGEVGSVVVDVVVSAVLDIAIGGPSGESLAIFTGIRAARAADRATDAGKTANLGNFKVASKGQLKGVDQHAFKQSVMGEKASVKSHNISLDKKGNVVLTPVRKGGETIETGYNLKELPKEFPKKR